MEDIIEYFTDIFHLERHVELPLGIVEKLNALDRAQRGELKSRLFTEAKRLGVGGDGLRAIRWLETTFDQIEKYSFRLHEVLFSPGQDIPENLAFYLSQAKTSIDLCVFTISDDVLSGCLKALHGRGVKIRIITDNNKMRDAGSQIKELARCGIDVKVDNSRYHMHNKFGIIDSRIAFTGSYNWTYTAKLHNQENLLLTTNFTIVHRFVDEFAMLWEQMFRLDVKATNDGQLKARVRLGKAAHKDQEQPRPERHPARPAYDDNEDDEERDFSPKRRNRPNKNTTSNTNQPENQSSSRRNKKRHNRWRQR